MKSKSYIVAKLSLVICFLFLISSKASACDISTDIDIVGVDEEKNQVLVVVKASDFADYDSGVAWGWSSASLELYEVTKGLSKLKKVGFSDFRAPAELYSALANAFGKNGFKPAYVLKFKNNSNSFESKRYKISYGDKGELTVVDAKNKKSSMKNAYPVSGSATELVSPEGVYIVNDKFLIGATQGCGKFSGWGMQVNTP